MMSYSHGNAHLAYRSASNHGQMASASPHGLIAMLMDGALERIARARGCIQNKDFANKALLLHRAVAIIDELQAALDLKKGGEFAGNLSELYSYMCRQLLRATVENSIELLDEVMRLMQQIRDAWKQMPQDAKSGR
ncbi:MAG TPA: flagellar export chaperone FliS [Steroidobacteraceae bacterium]|nr:flagellar export chaperone FliS [Steroidobacteraceae bacterium]